MLVTRLTYIRGINTVRGRTGILNNNVIDVIQVSDNMGKYKDTLKYVFIFMFEDILLTPIRSIT